MIENLIASMPLYVCTFWSVLLLLDVVERRQKAKLRLLAYMSAAALLYMGHYVFFNHITALLPLTDTIYSTMNLAVFPLYYIYLKELTEPAWNHRWQWLLLLPATVGGAVIGLLYALMSPAETAQFVDTYLYHNQTAGLVGPAWWQGAAHSAGGRGLGYIVFVVAQLLHGLVALRIVVHLGPRRAVLAGAAGQGEQSHDQHCDKGGKLACFHDVSPADRLK